MDVLTDSCLDLHRPLCTHKNI